MGRPAEPAPGAPVGRRIVLGLRERLTSAVVVEEETADGEAGFGSQVKLRDEESGDEKTYRLQVGGLVAQPASYRLDDLRALPQTSFTSDFHCVTGWVVPSVRWAGVPLSELLDRARPSASARAVRFRSFDGAYTESLSIEDARRSRTIVALEMLDGPVSHDHGGPVRMYVDGQYGYKSTKWLSGIELTEDEVPGYWEHRGYDIDGTIRE